MVTISEILKAIGEKLQETLCKQNLAQTHTRMQMDAWTHVRMMGNHSKSRCPPSPQGRRGHNKLERMQRHAAHWATEEKQRMASVIEMLVKLGWETQEVRRSTIRLAMFYNILHNLIAIQTTQLNIKTNATTTTTKTPCPSSSSKAKLSYYH